MIKVLNKNTTNKLKFTYTSSMYASLARVPSFEGNIRHYTPAPIFNRYIFSSKPSVQISLSNKRMRMTLLLLLVVFSFRMIKRTNCCWHFIQVYKTISKTDIKFIARRDKREIHKRYIYMHKLYHSCKCNVD